MASCASFRNGSGRRVIDDRYELLQPLSFGGMGRVFRAWDHRLRRTVAVKAIPKHAEPEDRSRKSNMPWQWEAWVMDVARHPYAVALYDALEDDGWGYLVMEFVVGGDLKRYVHEAGPLPCSDVVRVGMQICLALDTLHSSGIVHCDVKPHNILRSPCGWVKLADFGIACRAGAPRVPTNLPYSVATPEHRPNTGLPRTPTYCAPEQAQCGWISAATDLYSLGAVLYELLMGDAPHLQGMPLGYALAQGAEDAAPLRRLREDVPSSVEQVIFRALEKDPRDRFLDAPAMFASLADAAAEVCAPTAPAAPSDSAMLTRSIVFPSHDGSPSAHDSAPNQQALAHAQHVGRDNPAGACETPVQERFFGQWRGHWSADTPSTAGWTSSGLSDMVPVLESSSEKSAETASLLPAHSNYSHQVLGSRHQAVGLAACVALAVLFLIILILLGPR